MKQQRPQRKKVPVLAHKKSPQTPADQLLDRIVEHYLASRDFNGLPASAETDADLVAGL